MYGMKEKVFMYPSMEKNMESILAAGELNKLILISFLFTSYF